MKKLFLATMFFCLLLPLFAAESIEKIDLNIASFEQIKHLPITEQQAKDIYDYRTYIAFFESIFDLRKIESIDQKTMLKLKDYVIISHFKGLSDTEQRREDLAYKLERLNSEESSMSDFYLDYLMNQRNINELFMQDIMNLPGVTPIDAYAVIKRTRNEDYVKDYRDLRKSDGISYFGARNMRDYVRYKPSTIDKKFSFDYQFQYADKPFDSEEEEDNSSEDSGETIVSVSKRVADYSPEVANKMRFRYGKSWNGGIAVWKKKMEESIFDKDSDEHWNDIKFFVSNQAKYKINNDVNFVNIYAGNYHVAFGQGLVMDNTDEYRSRNTGMGFSNRVKGVIGDISKNQEYALRGAAVEWKRKNTNVVIFGSIDKKDAVLYDSNADSLFGGDDGNSKNNKDMVLTYISSTVRSDYDTESNSSGYKLAPVKDALEEKVLGYHVEFEPMVGSSIGLSGYEMLYDRHFYVAEDPDILFNSIIISEADKEKIKSTDAEIQSLYSTKTDDYSRNYRRVYGFDWRTVINNVAFQGEYAEMEKDGKFLKIADDPKAIVSSIYTQYENLNFLMMYRDYDLGYDNPYNRGFSEHQKFDDTVFDKYSHILTNPELQDLYENSVQPQAERGFFFQTRYKFTKSLTLNHAYIDVWERKSDLRKSMRFQGELEYRPSHPLRYRLKYKHQVNRHNNDADRSKSTTDEITMKVTANLSRYDQLSVEYRYNQVHMPPYNYLFNNADPDGQNTRVSGNVLMRGDYVLVDYIHNFNDDLKVQGSFVMWDGNGISHWDYEDMEIDFMGEGGTKYWITLHDRISNNLYVKLKYKIKSYKTQVLDLRTWTNEELESSANGGELKVTERSVFVQLDWKF